MKYLVNKHLKIEGIDCTYLVKYKVGYEPLMSSDTGRSIQTGEMKGRLVGIFPKIYLRFNIPDGTNMNTVKNLFHHLIWNKNMSVEYFSPATNTIETGTFYANTLDLELIPDNFLEEFDINLIATKRVE